MSIGQFSLGAMRRWLIKDKFVDFSIFMVLQSSSKFEGFSMEKEKKSATIGF